MKESNLINNIIKMFRSNNSSVIVGPGDDTAVIDLGDKKHYFLFTVDEMVENTHFVLSFLKPEEIASKLVRMNVSDIYSMGESKPLYCLVSGGINFDKVDDKWVISFLNALKKEIGKFSMVNIGGNLTKSKDIFFSMSVIGKVKKNRIIRRTGAKLGDLFCCIGKTGMSMAAVEIMNIKKRTNLTEMEEKLVSCFSKPKIYSHKSKIISLYASSMIDNSDGLYKSAEILSNSNGFKIILDYEKIYQTCDNLLIKWAMLNNKDPGEYSLFGGEDYNLIFTISSDNLKILSKKIKNIYPIGFIENGKGVEVLNYNGNIKNFEHF